METFPKSSKVQVFDDSGAATTGAAGAAGAATVDVPAPATLEMLVTTLRNLQKGRLIEVAAIATLAPGQTQLPGQKMLNDIAALSGATLVSRPEGDVILAIPNPVFNKGLA